MRDVVMAALLGSALLASPAVAGAQTAAPAPAVVVPRYSHAPGTTPLPPREHAAPVPSERLLGVPVIASAPVSPSYGGTAYKTLGGQAETGQDAISGQSMPDSGSLRPK